MISRLRCLFGLAVLISFASLVFAGAAGAQTPFYTASTQELSGRPGTLIRYEPMIGAPLGSSAYRILYRSTGLNGKSIAVSGVVVIPWGDSPANGRPIVAWAHPTSGVVPHCAPSLALVLFQTIQGLREMVEHGYVVVATDYPGLGTAEPHPYLVGVSEGRAVLDSVRAARLVPDANAGRLFVVWGHSQGGQASFYTGLLASQYAPDLKLIGVAAAAPATELATLLSDDFDTPGGRSLTAMTLWSWSRVFGADINTVVKPAAVPAINLLANICIESLTDLNIRRYVEAPLERAFLSVNDITKVEPWHSLLVRNTPGPIPRTIPVFLAQGSTDDVVLPRVTHDYMRRLCRNGSKVRMVDLQGVGHGFIALRSADEAVEWMANRFAGNAPSNDCAR
jgi:pimeloyl-ACP methyl ester carboxylesterase